MSIASEISRINNNISAAYIACSNKGATMPATENSANLADTIESIPQGRNELKRKDVNFYDYDGTLLYSYTMSQAAGLTALPTAPNHDGLLFQCWNYTLEQILDSVQSNCCVDAGAVYVTDDDSTRLYLFVAKGTRIPDIQIWVNMERNSSATVDWGDGTTGTLENTSGSEAAVFAEKTDYSVMAEDTVVCVRIIGGSFKIGKSSAYTLFGNVYSSNSEISKTPVLIKAELGSNCKEVFAYAFYGATVETVVLHQNLRVIGNYSFYQCSALRYVVVPSGITNVSDYAFALCRSLVSASLPMNRLSFADSLFRLNDSFKYIAVPKSCTGFIRYAFRESKALTSITLTGMQSIYSYAFGYCYRLGVVDLSAFTDPTALPVLAEGTAFSGNAPYRKFLVANQTMLDAFSSATNWSSYADAFVIKGATS